MTTAVAKKRVYLIDRHEVSRAGLRMSLDAQADMTVCGEGGCLRDGLPAVKKLAPELLVLEPLCQTGMRVDEVARYHR